MQVSIPYGRGHITHIRTDRSAPLISILKDALFIDETAAHFLLNIGAVYVDFQRVTKNVDVSAQTILRIHQNPLRFDVNHDWKKHVVFSGADFVIVDKPSRLPTHATLDNLVENTCYQVQSFLGCPLYVTHRLDTATKGLVLFAKNKKYQAAFNAILQKRRVRKVYRAKTSKLLPTGTFTHYMKPSNYAPKEMSDHAHPGWLRCDFRIHDDGKIELLTGRTHQIRAQLAHMGFPLIGDPVYSDGKDDFDLTCVQLEFQCPLTQNEYSFKI